MRPTPRPDVSHGTCAGARPVARLDFRVRAVTHDNHLRELKAVSVYHLFEETLLAQPVPRPARRRSRNPQGRPSTLIWTVRGDGAIMRPISATVVIFGIREVELSPFR